jgi:hypothetical protein
MALEPPMAGGPCDFVAGTLPPFVPMIIRVSQK